MNHELSSAITNLTIHFTRLFKTLNEVFKKVLDLELTPGCILQIKKSYNDNYKMCLV
jgi:hypothetical protein